MRWLIALSTLTVAALLLAVGGMGWQQYQTASADTGCGHTPAPQVHGKLTQQQIEQLWISADGPPSEATTAGAVAMAESHGDPNIVNSIGATGLWQILLSAHPDITSTGAKDPEESTRYAVKLWRTSGWQPWEAYTTGAYQQYVGKVERGTGTPALPVPCAVTALPGGITSVTWDERSSFPAPLPGFPGEACDPRIIPNLLALVTKYKLFVTDCYAPTGHASDGEHPLGLAADLVPGPGGSWDLVDRLAAWAEPVQNQPRKPFRWVGYNGDANHGRGNHLHLSWASSRDGPPAHTVTVLTNEWSSP